MLQGEHCRSKVLQNAPRGALLVKSIAECSPLEHSAKLSTFIKVSFVIEIFVLSYFYVAVLHSFYCIYPFSMMCVVLIHACNILDLLFSEWNIKEESLIYSSQEDSFLSCGLHVESQSCSLEVSWGLYEHEAIV